MRILVATVRGPVKSVSAESGTCVATLDLPEKCECQRLCWLVQNESILLALSDGTVHTCRVTPSATFGPMTLLGHFHDSPNTSVCRLLAPVSGGTEVVTVTDDGEVRVHGCSGPGAKGERKGGFALSGLRSKKVGGVQQPMLTACCVGVWDGKTVLAYGGRDVDVQVAEVGGEGKVIWKAKRRAPDPRTQLPDPVWPTCMAFSSTQETTLFVGTRYGEIRVYDTVPGGLAQRSPLAVVKVSERPLTCMCVSGTRLVLAGTTTGELVQFDPVKRLMVGSFRGVSASVRDVVDCGGEAVACSSLDRFVHVWETKWPRSRIAKAYVKQECWSLVVTTDKFKRRPEDAKTSEQLWDAIAEDAFDPNAAEDVAGVVDDEEEEEEGGGDGKGNRKRPHQNEGEDEDGDADDDGSESDQESDGEEKKEKTETPRKERKAAQKPQRKAGKKRAMKRRRTMGRGRR